MQWSLPPKLDVKGKNVQLSATRKARAVETQSGPLKFLSGPSDGQKLTKKLITNSLINLFQLDQQFN